VIADWYAEERAGQYPADPGNTGGLNADSANAGSANAAEENLT
jgi:hypothetical protein